MYTESVHAIHQRVRCPPSDVRTGRSVLRAAGYGVAGGNVSWIRGEPFLTAAPSTSHNANYVNCGGAEIWACATRHADWVQLFASHWGAPLTAC